MSGSGDFRPGLALRWLAREWRAGELLVLATALVIAVTAISAVGFFTDRVSAAMERRAAEVLAADSLLRSRDPLPPHFREEAERRGLNTAEVATLPTVVASDTGTQLVDLRAVEAAYPLRGELRISEQAFGPGQVTRDRVEPGTVWADARLLASLDLSPGESLEIGERTFEVRRILADLPDQGIGFADVAPAVLMAKSDLDSTGLLRPGSRISWRLLVAGERGPLREWQHWAGERLESGQRLQDVSESRQEIGAAIDRAERFLGLAALVSVMVAAVAVALSAREWARRRLDAVAIMKTLGSRQGQVLGLLLTQMLVLGLLAATAGVVLGWLAQWGLVATLGNLLGESLPAAEPGAAVAMGLGTALILMLGFALPPLMRLRRTPPARVLRRELAPPAPSAWLIYGTAITAIAALIMSQARDPMLSAAVLIGGGATLLLLMAGGLVLIAGLRRVGGHMGSAWRQGLGNLVRYPGRSLAMMTAFGLGLMVLALLTTVRGDLLDGWRATVPDDAPNHFLINIQPDEREGVAEILEDIGVPSTRFDALVRGRLIAINDRDADGIDFPSERGSRFVQRDANLSWASEPQADNRVVAGQWWNEEQHDQALVSLEEEIAEALGVGIGDRLRYRIGGEEIELTVSNLRSVRWDSFNTNFFVLVPPDLLDEFSATWITSVYVPAEARPELRHLVRAYPSVTVIDVDSILQQVRDIIDRASLAVEYVFLFTLLAGLTVLFAAVQASRDQRRFESALVRALGGRRRHVLATVATEFGVAGALAGLLAGVGASVAGWQLAVRVFELEYQPALTLVPGSMLVGMLLLMSAGWVATRRVVTRSPMLVLREE
ncbi:ABC transporter permease [Natronospira bacteriovora]|uniref:FtsX-like permease family protein n=1 Tax=Natronospira bacteriovora TaxID=3069753 RepID=A0ABU0W862_9GAMM|nr:FtsX-like permease family protein [Natronospira sp. AB-CW4]MDQ2070222.1 FtsX-like permease family protein [Natronospira sp. AB-CW4]